MKITYVFILYLISVQLYACNKNKEIEPGNNSNDTVNTDSMKLKVIVGHNVFTASRLGRIDNISALAAVLGSGNVTVTFTLEF